MIKKDVKTPWELKVIQRHCEGMDYDLLNNFLDPGSFCLPVLFRVWNIHFPVRHLYNSTTVLVNTGPSSPVTDGQLQNHGFFKAAWVVNCRQIHNKKIRILQLICPRERRRDGRRPAGDKERIKEGHEGDGYLVDIRWLLDSMTL